MIEHELLLLGLLKESPKHGYDIKMKIQEILFLFAGVDLKSIYYPLRIMERKGLVSKRADRRGRRPMRFVYALTPKGEHRFEELLTKNFLDFKRPQFSLDVSLYFLNYSKPAIARRRLRARLSILRKIAQGIKEMLNSSYKNKPTFINLILEHNLQMLETESRFLTNLIQSL